MSDYTPSEHDLLKNCSIRDATVVALTHDERKRGLKALKAQARAEAFNDSRHNMQVSLDEAIKGMKSRAWDEGYKSGQADDLGEAVNPHREDDE